MKDWPPAWLLGLVGCAHVIHVPPVPAPLPEPPVTSDPTTPALDDNLPVDDSHWISVPLGPFFPPTYTLVVFDERWGWAPGSYDLQISGLVDQEEQPVVITCLAEVPSGGYPAGSYAIEGSWERDKHEDRIASCTGDVQVDWALLPEVVGGVRIWRLHDVAGTDIQIRVVGEDGVLVHEASAAVVGRKHDARYAFLGPVPLKLRGTYDYAVGVEEPRPASEP